MMIFIHKICMAFSGLGNFIKVEMVIKDRAAILLEYNEHNNEKPIQTIQLKRNQR